MENHRRKISAICCLTIGIGGLNTPSSCEAFSPQATSRAFIQQQNKGQRRTLTKIHLQAPPGSGYIKEEEESYYPDSYDPMMEYPGTMRPGRTKENQPFSSLPIQESDPDPVPWPHFQEIEWHHNWGSPHEHPIPMEEFIDMHGRWATAEMEAEMRAGARRGVRERRELEEAQKAASFILDDDEEDDEEEDAPKLDLGEGVDALMDAGAAVAAPEKDAEASALDEEEEDDDDDDADEDSFLLDLGLDGVDAEDDVSDDADDDGDDDDDDGQEPAFATSDDGTEGILEAMQTMIDAEDGSATAEVSSDDDAEIDINFDDLGLSFEDDADDEEAEEEGGEEGGDEDDEDFVLMDDDDVSIGNEDLTLDEMIGNEDMGADDEFDDGGFDYD